MTPEDEKKDASKTPEAEKPAAPQDEIVETKHCKVLNGKELHYTVRTGRMVLKKEVEKEGADAGKFDGDKPKASIFFVAYTLDDVEDKTKRPLTFSYNGGPGSSSVWLHLGVLGPCRVEMDAEGMPLPPPYRLVDNDYSLLDVTDLVFIDPVSTGYSRVVEGEKASTYHGYKKDIESVGDFIRLYTTRSQRWGSPKYLIGESYGTTRSAGLSGYLAEEHGMYLNGIMLVSCVLDFATLRFHPGNELPYAVYLPTFTATAWYHQQLAPDLQADLQKALKESEEFAAGEYTLALVQGAALTGAKRQKIVKKLARLTGLSETYIEQTDLRVEIFRFTKELMRKAGLTVGRLDSRFTGYDRDSAGEMFERDPSMSAITGPYTACLYDYVRGELNYTSDLPYKVLTGDVHPWSYAEFEGQYVYVAETLRQAIVTNPYMRVHVANGYYDLATPHFATVYTFNHLGIPQALQKNISMSFYEAGHMMYLHLPSLEKLHTELAEFIKG